jgi:hypothetical protein
VHVIVQRRDEGLDDFRLFDWGGRRFLVVGTSGHERLEPFLNGSTWQEYAPSTTEATEPNIGTQAHDDPIG